MRGMTERDRAARIVAELGALRLRVGIPDSLGIRGVRVADIPELAVHAANDACLVTNPRRVQRGDIEAIFGDAL
jgi:alcohol dehydrogenase class IV